MGELTITYCDRCKRKNGPIIEVVKVGIDIFLQGSEERHFTRKNYFNDYYDLCPSCKDYIIDTVKDALRSYRDEVEEASEGN